MHLTKTSSSHVYKAEEGVGLAGPQTRFDRPRHPGFELFNTRKTRSSSKWCFKDERTGQPL